MKIQFLKNNLIGILILITIGLLVNSMLIINPGFFSHDELSLLNFTDKINISDLNWLPPPIGNNFYRPVGYNIGTIIFKISNGMPQIIHLFHVLLHIGISLLTMLIVRHLFKEKCKHIDKVSFLLVVSSPLSTLPVGWAVGFYEQLYLLFCLLTIILIIKTKEKERILRKILTTIAIIIFSASAILSKETAIMLPAYIIAILGIEKILNKKKIRKKIPYLIITIIISIIYFLIRYKAITSIAVSEGPYSMDIGRNLIKNSTLYFVYPFIWKTAEIGTTAITSTKFGIITSGILHALILFLLFKKNYKYALLYIIGFALPLLPVLSLSKIENQYLYTSAIAISVAIAYLLIVYKNKLIKGVVIVSIILLLMHSANFQYYLLNTGIIQRNLTSSLSEIIQIHKTDEFEIDKNILIIPDQNSITYILARTIAHLSELDKVKITQIKIGKEEDVEENDDLVLKYDKKGFLRVY